MATRKKSSSTRRKTKKERMEEMAKKEAFRKEVFLWIILAVSILLFISNFGIGGNVGNIVSDFLFGIFGMVAYVFPIILLLGSFFSVSNKGNNYAILKICSGIAFFILICIFLYLAVYGDGYATPIESFIDSRTKHSGGGIVGGIFGSILVPSFGIIGSYVIVFVLLIVSIVLFTEKSIMKGMRDGGKKVYDTAKENNEKYQEYREYKSKEKATRRMDKKVQGVSLDTKIEDVKPDSKTDEMGELHVDENMIFPEISEVASVPLESDLYPKASVFESEVQSAVTDEIIFPKEEPVIEAVQEEIVPQIEEPKVVERIKRKTKPSDEEIAQEVKSVAEEIEKQDVNTGNYIKPYPELLNEVKRGQVGDSKEQLIETQTKLEQTLNVFGVNAKVTSISRGPAVTRFEITPELGVKVSKIVNLADDIKLNLAAADIRIEAPIPGKPAVGIEVPNSTSVMVSFRELIESEEFKSAGSNLTFAVGKDIGGKVMVTDIAKMPHLLIAGATGSGKSVCINTIIMSILFKAKPDDVKLIMIDPKVVELSVYNGIPHLMIPVVTDPKKAASALNWAVAEMTERYQKFAEYNVREINGYNKKVAKLEVSEEEKKSLKMPQIVIIVDELADLMMVASKDVEEAICRLAQLARAAGIHLIIATQRPSVNVITGLIKANMPSRIAFAVTSGVDSRTILDMNGAEKLLGKGDMLFNPQGIPKPLRVQGAFVSDEEVSEVVNYIIDNNENAQYSNDVQQKMESMENSSLNTTVSISDVESSDDGRDSLFTEAASIITDKEKASIGMLQRYLKIGFNRAARIMDQLEEAGVVGPEEGTKPRKVLVTKEDLETILNNEK